MPVNVAALMNHGAYGGLREPTQLHGPWQKQVKRKGSNSAQTENAEPSTGWRGRNLVVRCTFGLGF